MQSLKSFNIRKPNVSLKYTLLSFLETELNDDGYEITSKSRRNRDNDYSDPIKSDRRVNNNNQ